MADNHRRSDEQIVQEVLSDDPDSASNLALRQSISCGASLAEDIGAPPPDIDDGGDTPHGNLQIHPEINHKACP